MGKFFLALCLLVSAALCETVDVVTNRNGGTYLGSVVEQDSAAIALEFEDGSRMRIPLSAVERIQYRVDQDGNGNEKGNGRQPRGYHQHDGFFLSINLGGGPTFDIWDRSSSNGSGTARVSGPAMDVFDVKIGGAVKENLILSFDVFGSATLDSRASGDGLNVNGLGLLSPQDTVFGDVIASLGIGVTYYFMPRNIFVSGSLGIASMSIYHKHGTTGDSVGSYREDWRYSEADGYAFRLKVGKEWWVSKNWGLGIAAAYCFFQGKELKGDADDPSFALDPSYKGDLTSHRMSVLFNTTFN